MLYFKLSSMLMFDVYNNTAPHNISHLFIPTQQIPRRTVLATKKILFIKLR